MNMSQRLYVTAPTSSWRQRCSREFGPEAEQSEDSHRTCRMLTCVVNSVVCSRAASGAGLHGTSHTVFSSIAFALLSIVVATCALGPACARGGVEIYERTFGSKKIYSEPFNDVE